MDNTMSKLIFLGCSHGKFGKTPDNIWIDEKSVAQVLANKLNLPLINLSLAGTNNFDMFQRIIFLREEQLDRPSWLVPLNGQISNDDILFVQWTYTTRQFMKLPDDVKTAMPHSEDKHIQDYYDKFFDMFQESSKIIGYTRILQKYFKKVLVNFCDGWHNMTYRDIDLTTILGDTYLNVNPISLWQLYDPGHHFTCGHLTQEGNELLANDYYNMIVNRNLL